jgi:hypothetical protein
MAIQFAFLNFNHQKCPVSDMTSLLMQVSSQRLSIGMTPKTLRLPKPGEMLLSVRGSPLGVYKEDNMEAIHGMLLMQKYIQCLCNV